MEFHHMVQGQYTGPITDQVLCCDNYQVQYSVRNRHYRKFELGKSAVSILVSSAFRIKPLNAELNPICHLLVLLGDLTFMCPCIVSISQYISNKMQRYTVYLYLETVLHISDGTSTHHQERIQLYLQHLVFVTPV
jgi:hypothetical protein